MVIQLKNLKSNINKMENLNFEKMEKIKFEDIPKKIPYHYKETEWDDCCRLEMARHWIISGGPEKIICHKFYCSKCSRFIGLTSTSLAEAYEFLNPKRGVEG